VAAITVIIGFGAVVAWRIYAPTPNVWTDDAYVRVHYTTIAPRVAGQVVSVGVDNSELVKAGEVLAELDNRDYRNAYAEAQAQVAAAQASIGTIEEQIIVQAAQISSNQAQVEQAQAALVFAQQQASRYQELAKTAIAGTIQDAQRYSSQRYQQTAALRAAQSALKQAQQQIKVLFAQRAGAHASLARAEAERDQAQLNLSYTYIRAPVDGMIAQRSVQVGNYVSPGAALMAVVPLSQVYIEANYREVALEHVRAGQSVRIHVDAYNIDLNGTVVGVPAATGAIFATLQPDDATGNFTKIVQRLPVRITVAPNQPLARLLRVGMSVETTIYTGLANVMAAYRDSGNSRKRRLATVGHRVGLTSPDVAKPAARVIETGARIFAVAAFIRLRWAAYSQSSIVRSPWLKSYATTATSARQSSNLIGGRRDDARR
jgi:membrane fusion protein (multidrug efflux system)